MRICMTTSKAAAVIAALLLPAAHGQWLKDPTPGIPRTPDGKPNLTAPAPKTHDGKPDLSGIWQTNLGGYGLNIAVDLKPGDVQPWADALYKQHLENLSKDHPGLRCLPDIGPFTSLGIYKILQTPSAVAFLPEFGAYRQVLTDGRGLPKDPNPSWQGYSVGHWEGDTLVIESAGFNDKTWLDFSGHPHSEALRVTERFHRKDFGHLDLKMTFDDPKAYNRPWTIALTVDLMPDTELLEYVCNENERDVQHIVVTEEDRKKARTNVKIAPEILSKYTGLYQPVDHEGKPVDKDGKPVKGDAKPETFAVIVENDQLVLQIASGGGKIPLTAESESQFSVAGQPVDFVRNDQGVVTHLVFRAVEGDQKAIRQRDLP
jgi:hypothetical protein